MRGDPQTPNRGPGAPTLDRDERGFDAVFTDAWPWAFRLASLLTQDDQAGAEIAQDALINLYRAWDRVDRPEAYLRTSIVNASHNHHRRKRVHRAKLPLLDRTDRVDFAADELADVIAGLPFRQRAVVVLRYYADLSEQEIAEAIGCRPGTVKSLASRALATMRKELRP